MAKQMEVLLKSVRKWDTDFLCIGNKNESFSVPQPEDITPRIMANLEYFRVNYTVCLALFALVSIVIYPQLLVLVCVFSGLWYALYTRPANTKFEVGAMILTMRHCKL